MDVVVSSSSKLSGRPCPTKLLVAFCRRPFSWQVCPRQGSKEDPARGRH
jgi:hypothetical protein